jgi:hypothetical protein
MDSVIMMFTMLGLISAMLFGVFFGSEGQLPPETQDAVFFGLISGGATLHALQILYEKICESCHCRICRGNGVG